jgi:hypothetical protein
MTKHTTAGGRVPRRGWRHALVWIAAVGLLGSAAQAGAIVRLERMALEARVQTLRVALRAAGDGVGSDDPGRAQTDPWANWNNWNNWNNWPNWGNWGNWLNR